MNDKLISDEYLAQNAELHKTNRSYGALGGKKWAGRVVTQIKACRAKSYLDYGCGKGQLLAAVKQALPSIEANGYDPATRPGEPAPADYVSCTDVLEHIEPELLENVLKHIRACTKDTAFLVICLIEDKSKLLPDGRNPHLIVENEAWWVKRLKQHFTEVQVVAPSLSRRVGKELAVVCKP